MGVGMDLEFEKYCKVEKSPRTVLQSSHHHAKHEDKSRSSKSSSKNSRVSVEAGFRDIKFRNYHRSVSCKTLPAKNNELAVDREVLKRGSVYQSSKERSSFKKPDNFGGRKKIELSLNGDSPFSFSLLDSICGSDEEKQEPSSSINKSRVKFDDRQTSSSRPAERDLMENSKFRSQQVVCPSNSANILKEDDHQPLSKSLFSKIALPHSPTRSDSDASKGSSVSRFTPIRKMLDPLTKSKSHKLPLSSKLENGVIESNGKSKTLQKSLLRDFSSSVPNVEKNHEQVVAPAHLHGDLKLEHKNGVPYFELSLGNLENVLVAKTWKAEDALNWVYTFHSAPGRKKSNASGLGVHSNKDSPMVGQMLVSCRLCSVLEEGETFSNSMMSEFVLYDIIHAKKGFSAEEMDAEPSGLDDMITPIKIKTHDFEYGSLDSLIPWTAADLHPSHEIAALVIQVPFEKKESLKHRSSEKFIRQTHSNLLDLSLSEQMPNGKTGDSSNTRLCVVTPLGNHSMPTGESKGPLPLLDRWRLGGGCDCGGWDMACPLTVFDNLSTDYKEENQSLMQDDQPFALYVQGAKEKCPALTIKVIRKGQYSVEFHAKLSALQALAICVAILQTTEASAEQRQRQLLQKVCVVDQVKLLIEKESEDQTPSFVLNPPFSPIARV